MAAFYIPYVVGSSAIAYIGKEMVSYLYSEDPLQKIENTEENTFLKNESEINPNVDIIEREESIKEECIENKSIEDLPKYSQVPIYDSVDREYQIKNEILVEPEETVECIESKKIVNKSVSFLINDCKLDKYNDTIDKLVNNKAFVPKLSIIEEEKEINDLKSQLQLPTKLYKCAKCTAFLPIKMFSKAQKKKTPKIWKCKVCLKLN